ncbi:hypothetical protein ACTU44_09735 [Thalassospira sp. SM2505]|uniref:hypothetical protein n=1 Tax=Thalassospira sp. CH_XMU1448-2 TaxID=3107773 RepID=UPI00300B4CB8
MRPISFVPILAGIALLGLTAFVGTARPTIELSYSANCKNVDGWKESLMAEGFDIELSPVNELTLSEQQAMMSLPEPMRDCKIASVAGYHVIGDVASGDIVTLLRRKPLDVVALAQDKATLETVALHYDGTVERRKAQ